MTRSDLDTIDGYRTDTRTEYPARCRAHLRARCPVLHETDHDVSTVRRNGQAVGVDHDRSTVSNCAAALIPRTGA